MNIDDIKKANAKAGHHYFSADTMRFFSSCVGKTVYGVWHPERKSYADQVGGQYFITSEKYDNDSPRLYTVRRYDPQDKTIATIGRFQEYRTSNGAAKRAIRECDYEQQTGKWNSEVTAVKLAASLGRALNAVKDLPQYAEGAMEDPYPQDREDGEGLGLTRPSYGE